MFDGSFSSAPTKRARLVVAEQELRDAHSEYERLAARQRELSDDVDGNVGEVLRLEQERAAMIERITELRSSVVALQDAHGAATRRALEPAIAQAASQALVAAIELQNALQGIDRINDQLRQNHSAEVFVLMPDIAGLIERLGKLQG